MVKFNRRWVSHQLQGNPSLTLPLNTPSLHPKHCRILSGAATSYNSRGGLSFAHLFSGSTPAHAMIIHKTASFIIHHISHFSMFPMALGTM